MIFILFKFVNVYPHRGASLQETLPQHLRFDRFEIATFSRDFVRSWVSLASTVTSVTLFEPITSKIGM